MKETALITGASSGIGAALARLHASKGGDLVLVARREDALDALRQELERTHGISATVIAADLSLPESAAHIYATTKAAGLRIDMLINNAGFGYYGKFHESDLGRAQDMMQVNMGSLVNLTHLYLQDMVARNSGRILHIASAAGLMPGPLQAVYYATKAFVVSFSQAIAEELSGSGVSSTVLCPGAVATGFEKAGNLEGTSTWDNAASADSVAACGYAAMEKGELLKINEPSLSFMLNWIAPLLPRKALLKQSRKSMEKSQ